MKKILLYLLILFCIPLRSNAVNTMVSNYVEYILNVDGTATVKGWGSVEYSTLRIPEKVQARDGKEFIVTSIQSAAFLSCTRLETVRLPESLTSIGDRAFKDCTGLTALELPASLTSIDSSAFSGCTGLTALELPESLTSIGSYAFYGCTGLTSVDLPASLTSIGSYAFSGCRGLTSVDLPASLTSIGKSAFSGCTGLTSVDLPKSLTSIGSYAFSGCRGLTSVDLPASLTSIGESAFSGCTGLTSVDLPKSLTSIGESAFSGCTGLLSVEVRGLHTKIGLQAFAGCESLRSVMLLTKSFDRKSFEGCSGLKKIAIPEGSSGYFGNIRPSIIIYFNPNEANTENGILYGLNNNQPSTILYVPDTVEGAFSVDETVERIGQNAFSECVGLTSLTIANTVTEIGDSAFSGCTNLEDIIIADGSEELGFKENVFTNVPIKKLYIGRSFSTTSLESAPFSGMESLTEVMFGETLTLISDNAFPNCTGLTALALPESLTEIGDNAFRGCTGLTALALPESLTGIGDSAFSGCTGFSTLTFPESLTEIGASAFSGCTGLTSVELPESVTEIGDYWFSDCSGLTSLPLSNSVEIIGKGAFMGCTGLTSIDLPPSVKQMYTNSFTGCTGIDAIVLHLEKPAFYNAFSAYANQATLVIPDGSEHAYFMSGWANFFEIRYGENVSLLAEVDRIKYRTYVSKGENARNEAILVEAPNISTIEIQDRVIVNGNERYNVVAIGYEAFKGCNRLTNLSFNQRAEIKELGDHAFNGCNNLASISIPASVTSIGYRAFYNCTGLNSATFASADHLCSIQFGSDTSSNPLSYAGHLYFADSSKEVFEVNVPEDCKQLYNSFTGGKYLKKIILPEGLEYIGFAAFYECKGLSTIEIPNTVNAIGNYAFYNCTGLKSANIPNKVETIGNYSFSGCTGITSLTIPGSIETIGDYCFSECGNLRELILNDGNEPLQLGEGVFDWNCCITKLVQGRLYDGFIPIRWLNELKVGNLVTSLRDFSDKASLVDVKLGSGITEIPENAFKNCGIKEIVIPPNVTEIGENAFANNKLTSVKMGSQITTVGAGAFSGNADLKNVYLTAMTVPEASDDVFSSYNDKNLWLMPGMEDEFYDAWTCWCKFGNYKELITPTELTGKTDETLKGDPGETVRLSVTLKPSNVTLPKIFWETSDPEVATVDLDGVVTFVGKADGECKITAKTLYPDAPTAEWTVKPNTVGVMEITADEEQGAFGAGSTPYPNAIFTMDGICVKRDATQADIDALAPGMYIVAGKKVVVK